MDESRLEKLIEQAIHAVTASTSCSCEFRCSCRLRDVTKYFIRKGVSYSDAHRYLGLTVLGYNDWFYLTERLAGLSDVN